MWKAFNIKTRRNAKTGTYIVDNYIEHPVDKNRKLFFLADPPHLFKNISAALINNKTFLLPLETVAKYKLPTDVVDFGHIQKVFDAQNNSESDLKFAPKLQQHQLKPNTFQKMKVNNAFHVLHPDVSTALKFLSKNESKPELTTTSWFIDLVYKWFYYMSSRYQINALSLKNKNKYEDVIDFFKEILVIFSNIKTGNGQWKPWQTGVLISTTSILGLQDYFLNQRNYGYLLTSRFSQDCLENLFCSVRSRQKQPSAKTFKNILKLIAVSQYLKDARHSSYSQDDRIDLSDFLDIIKTFPSSKTKKDITSLPPCPDEIFLVIFRNNDLSKANLNILYNVSGYILHVIEKCNRKCDDCFNHLIEEKDKTHIEEHATFTGFKEFVPGCLLYVTEETFNFFC